MKPDRGRELRHNLPYDDDEKTRLLKLVAGFRKKQEKAFARTPDREVARMLRDFLADNDFIGHVVDGWYIVHSDNPEDPIKEVAQRSWLVVDHKYVVDTCGDRWHPGEEGYKINITRIGDNKDYSEIKVSRSAARFNAKLKGFLKKPFKRPESGLVEPK